MSDFMAIPDLPLNMISTIIQSGIREKEELTLTEHLHGAENLWLCGSCRKVMI